MNTNAPIRQAAPPRAADPAGAMAAMPVARGPATDHGRDDEPLTVLAFTLAGHQFAVRVEAVLEIIEEPPLMPLPASPPWMLGLVDLRGTTVPVVDLSAKLGLTPPRLDGMAGHGPAAVTDTGAGTAARAPADAHSHAAGGASAEASAFPEDIALRTQSAAGVGAGPRNEADAVAGPAERRIVVLDLSAVADDHGTAVGVLCERVNDVWTVPADQIEAVPAFVEAQGRGGAVDAGACARTREDRAIPPARAVLSGVLRHAGGLAMLLDHQAALGIVPGVLAPSDLAAPRKLVADD